MTNKRFVFVIIAFVAGVVATCAAISITGGRYVGVLPNVRYGDDLTEGSLDVNAQDPRLISAAYEIAGYIKDGDYKSLSEIAHPQSGVCFSPYATISEQAARVFMPSEIAGFSGDKQVYVWGVYDGSGEPIEMTPTEYFARFVFDRDYTRTKIVGVDYVVRSGNALENVSEVYPGIRFVDLYMPSTNGEDTNWSTLRLGFQEYDGSLMLTLILHSEPTL